MNTNYANYITYVLKISSKFRKGVITKFGLILSPYVRKALKINSSLLIWGASFEKYYWRFDSISTQQPLSRLLKSKEMNPIFKAFLKLCTTKPFQIFYKIYRHYFVLSLDHLMIVSNKTGHENSAVVNGN